MLPQVAVGDPILLRLIFVALLFVMPLGAQPAYPPMQGQVNDFAQAIDAPTKARLNTLLADVEAQTTAEMAVVVVETTAPATPKQYVTALFNHWGVGKRGADSGVMILLALNDRRVEIETGYGVEDILPDGKVGEIIRTSMLPHFKRQQWGEGLLAGSQEIARILRQAYQTPSRPSAPPPSEARSKVGFFATLVILLGIGLLVLRLIAARRARCRDCGERLRRRTRVLRAASYTRPGLREIVEDCPSCAYHEVHMASIPRRVALPARPRRPGMRIGGGWPRGGGAATGRSRGGGSFPSFGGGSSGGGGAGASF
jgi:uncharacterized membrane protein YgcG